MPELSQNGLSVRRYDRERFVTTLFAPPEQREDLLTLYAFHVEIARIRETVRELVLGQIRLQWWRDGLDAVMAGKEIGHPVADDLAALTQKRGLPRDLLDRMIEARDRDMTDSAPEDLPALLSYAEDSAGALLVLAMVVQGEDGEAARKAALAVGRAWGTLGMMRVFPYHARSRRLSLPLSWCREAGIDIEDLFAGESPAVLTEWARRLAGQARDDLAEARKLRGEIPKSAHSPLLLARQADHLLRGLEKSGFNLWDKSWSGVNGRAWSLLAARILGRF